MAQASTRSKRGSSSGTKRSSSRTSSNGGGPSASSSRSRGGSTSRKRTNNSSSTASKTRKRTSSAKSQATQAPASAKEAAAAGTKAAGKAVATAVSKAKTPLMVGGAAVVGVVGGAALRDRLAHNRSNGFVGRLKGVSMPSAPKVDLQGAFKSIDFDKVSKTAQRVGNYGRQVDEVATAVKNASESAKKAK